MCKPLLLVPVFSLLLFAPPAQAQAPIPCVNGSAAWAQIGPPADQLAQHTLARCADAGRIDWDEQIQDAEGSLAVGYFIGPAQAAIRSYLALLKQEKQHVADERRRRQAAQNKPAQPAPAQAPPVSNGVGADWRPVVKPMTESDSQRREREEFERTEAAAAGERQRQIQAARTNQPPAQAPRPAPSVAQRIQNLRKTIELNEDGLKQFQARNLIDRNDRREAVPIAKLPPITVTPPLPAQAVGPIDDVGIDDLLMNETDRQAIRRVNEELLKVPVARILELQKALDARRRALVTNPNPTREMNDLDVIRIQVMADLEIRRGSSKTPWVEQDLIHEFHDPRLFQQHVVPALERQPPR